MHERDKCGLREFNRDLAWLAVRVDLGNAAEWAAVVAAVAAAALAWWKANQARASAEAAEADRKAAHEARMAVEKERNEIQGRMATTMEQRQRAEDERRRTEQAELVTVEVQVANRTRPPRPKVTFLVAIRNKSLHPITDCVAIVGCGAVVRDEGRFPSIPSEGLRQFNPSFESCEGDPFGAVQFRDLHGQVWYRTQDGALHTGEFHPGG